MDPIINYYTTTYDEQARFDNRYNQIEFITTMCYIEKYLHEVNEKTSAPRILEVGAGTGRYSRAIADLCYIVDALELTPRNIDTFRSLITPTQSITLAQGNALDLSRYADNTFDITLVLGPLYHLFTTADKHQCIAEAIRVTKPGGVIFAAYVISDMCIMDSGLRLARFDVADYLKKGKIDPYTFATTSIPDDVFEMCRKEDIDALMAPFNTKRLHYIATTLAARFLRDALEEMPEERFALYMHHHLAICERPDMVGMTSHSLDVFRKQ
ncbi:MAG: class I SAM-dependent methyltransferase [Defluviitaleaceae bacterium]|nr:class I SAM-dependent methyltransferase [Defluviitaleaceae bacterium]